MKTFNFRKLGILLVMMLVGAMVLIGPASAYSQVYTDDYRLRCGGSVSSTSTVYWTAANTRDYDEAYHIEVIAEIHDAQDNYLGQTPFSRSNYNSATAQGEYIASLHGGYVHGSFEGIDPDDSYSNLVYHLS